MPRFTDTSPQLDPYRSFRFLVSWDGRVVAGVSKVSGLGGEGGAVGYRTSPRDGHAARHAALSAYEPITLERGLTRDPELQLWLQGVAGGGATRGDALPQGRQEVTIALLDEEHLPQAVWKVLGCRVSEANVLISGEDDAQGLLIERLRLDNEGWSPETPTP